MLAGATLVANGVELNYPFEVCITNLLACCDHVFVATDLNNRDDTLARLRSLADPKKLTILDSVWDWTLNMGHDLAFRANQCIKEALDQKFDSVLYLQADEIVHPREILDVRYIYRERFFNLSLERTYFWRDLNHIKTSWTLPIPRMCSLTEKVEIVGDGMFMKPDDMFPSRTIINDICRIYHCSRVGNPKHMVNRINVLDAMFHEKDEYAPLTDYCFGSNNNFEEGAEIDDVKVVTLSLPPGLKEFYNA